MQRQNMIFIFFIAFLLIIFLGYLFVVGDQNESSKGKTTTTKVNEETLGECNFDKLYNLLLVTDSDDGEYIHITLKEFQVDEVKTIRIKRDAMPSLKKGNYYLFSFKTNKKIHDHIEEIFDASELVSVKDHGKDVDGIQAICETHLIED